MLPTQITSGNSLPGLIAKCASDGAKHFNSTSGSPSFHDCLGVMSQKYQAYQRDPKSIDQEWKDFFANLSKGGSVPLSFDFANEMNASSSARPSTASAKYRNLMIILRAYQIRGHLVAKVDPLDLPRKAGNKGRLWGMETDDQWNPDKIVATLGLTEDDLHTEFDFDPADLNPHHRGFLSGTFKGRTVHQFIDRLNQVYCKSIGYEFVHIQDPKKLMWLMNRIELETPCYKTNKADTKKKLLKALVETQGLEDTLQKKFPTTKRFGLDGCESLVPMLQEICSHGESDSFVLGMAHRGRLNVLSNVFHKPTADLFREFKGAMGFGGSAYGNNGDVKYHLGVVHERPHATNASRMQQFTMLCNPSHLETVDPVVIGKAKAMQDRTMMDKKISRHEAMKKIMPIIIHGDSSTSGQGIVYETAQMQNLEAYDVGGTVHLISNNQIGFTTTPGQYLSSRYCTDLMRGFDCPVFHVNADDIEACQFVAQMAVDYRNKFHSDVVIDVIGYRRMGHNEQDMPSFTNPLMYNVVANHPRASDLYAAKLIADGIMTEAEVKSMTNDIMDQYLEDLKHAEGAHGPDRSNYTLDEPWKLMDAPDTNSRPRQTGICKEELQALGKELFTMPKGFTPHRTIGKLMEARVKAMKTGNGIDFGTAEALAFGTLLSEGNHIRVCGQDTQRGTFSHRHAVLHDNVNFESHTPLAELVGNTPAFQVHNSHLSEYAALGFEVGYALQHPNNLTIWEAQFGDFANGAQIMIDTVLASGEVKWGQQNGLVMYLPHGYDGMGPEHSSARVERFLALCDNREDLIDPVNFDPQKRRIIQTSNLQVIIPTTPSNLFHALRRQIARGFRKPLIVVQSKKLLKLRQAQSSLDDMAAGSMFIPFYGDVSTRQQVKNESVERLVLCAGQVYYDLEAQRAKLGDVNSTKTAIARVEQLCPLPYKDMIDEMNKYPNLKSVVWCQEESMNAGMWTYMNPRLQTMLMYTNSSICAPIYVGRDVCASTATGCPKIHHAELAKFLGEAFDHSLTHHSPKAFFNVDDSGVKMQPIQSEELYQHHGRKI